MEVIDVMYENGDAALMSKDFWADSMMKCRCRGLGEEVVGVVYNATINIITSRVYISVVLYYD